MSSDVGENGDRPDAQGRGKWKKVGRGMIITCDCRNAICKRPHKQRLTLAVLAKIEAEDEVRLLRPHGSGAGTVISNGICLMPQRSDEATLDDGYTKIRITSRGYFSSVHPSISCPCCNRNMRCGDMQKLTRAYETIAATDVLSLDVAALGRIVEVVSRPER